MKTMLFIVILLFSVSLAQDKSKDDKKVNKEDYVVKADDMPFPVGGMEAILKNIVYPEDAAADSIEGRVYVLAFINENGDVVKTEVIKSDHSVFNEAAVSAVNKVRFTPAKIKGKNVKAQITVPIMFKLQ